MKDFIFYSSNVLTHFINGSAYFINSNPIANYIIENNSIKINHEYSFRCFICLGYNRIGTPTAIGDSSNRKRGPLNPIFLLWPYGHGNQPNSITCYLDQVYLNISILKFKFQILNFKFWILNFKQISNFKFQNFEFQILNFKFWISNFEF